MVKSAKGAGAAKLVEDATAAPGVFVFAELLESPNIHQVFLFDLRVASHDLLPESSRQ